MAYLLAPGNHRFDLDKESMTLGEDPQADIPVARGFGIAQRHIALETAGDLHVLKPLAGSAAQTYVNGIRAELAVRLEHGDSVKVGELDLIYQNGESRFPPTIEEASQEPREPPREVSMEHVLEKLKTPTPRGSGPRKHKNDNFFHRYVLPVVALLILGHVVVGKFVRGASDGIKNTFSDIIVTRDDPEKEAFQRMNPQERRMLEGIEEILSGPPGYRIEEEVLPNEKFSFRTPAEPWRIIPNHLKIREPRDWNEPRRPTLPSLVYIHVDTRSVLSVTADRYRSSEAMMVADQLETLKKGDPATRVISSDAMNINGSRILKTTYESPVAGQVTDLWTCTRGDYGYRIMLTGERKHADLLARDGVTLLAGFSIHD